MRTTPMKMRSGALLIGALMMGMTASPSLGVLYMSEPFTYPNGNLVGQGTPPWFNHSGGTTNAVQVLGNQISVTTPGSQDVSKPIGFTMGAGQKIYAAFDVSVAGSLGNVTSADGAYFAHFKSNGTSQFRGRLYVASGSDNGVTANFTFGISAGGIDTFSTPSYPTGHAQSKWATDLTFGTTYRVVSSYSYDTGTVEMWVNPVNESSTKITIVGDNARRGFNDICAIPNPCGDAGVNVNDCCTADGFTAINAYCFRQSSGPAYGITETIDNLCVASTFAEALTCSPGAGLAAFGNASPNPVPQGSSVLLTATVSGGAPFAIPNAHYNVTGNLSSLTGGANPQTFYDDGTHGDLTANDNVYSHQMNLSCSQAIQAYSLPLSVSDTATTVNPSIGFSVTDGTASITFQPSDRIVCEHATTFFSVTAAGGGLTYQWYNGSNVAITDGGHYSGATTRILTITDVTAAEAANSPYYVKVTGACTGLLPDSTHVNLSIDTGQDATSQQVVISQVYGGGGCTNGTQCAGGFCNNITPACVSGHCTTDANIACVGNDASPCPAQRACSGAQDCGGNPTPCSLYDADFIEIYNQGSDPVNLKGWSVQYGAIGGTWLSTPLSATDFFLKPGQYFLVKEAPGNTGTGQLALPTPNATGNISMSAQAGYVALYKTTATLPTSNCPVTSGDCLLVDFVGFGSSATCFKGTGSAPTPDAPAGSQQSNAVVRTLCSDTDSNDVDFTAITAMPHNSSLSGTGSITGTGDGGLSDLNLDGVTNTADLTIFTNCLNDPKHPIPYTLAGLPGSCTAVESCDGKVQGDLDRDGDLDMNDFGIFQRCFLATPANQPDCFP